MLSLAIQNIIKFLNIVIFIIELHVKPFIKGWENNEILNNHLNWKVFVYVFDTFLPVDISFI